MSGDGQETTPRPLTKLIVFVVLLYLTFLLGTGVVWLIDVTWTWMTNYWRH